MAKAKKPEAIYKPGYVESELRRYATNPHLQTSDPRHITGMLCAAMLMILERLPDSAEPKP